MKRNERISKIMTPAPITVQLGQKLSDVQKKMSEGGFHHVPVVDGDKLVGILSSTDLLRVTYEYDKNPAQSDAVLDHTRSVEDVMQPSLVTISPKDTVRAAAEIFSKNAFHALPVCDNGALVGIVTTTDVINYMLEQY